MRSSSHSAVKALKHTTMVISKKARAIFEDLVDADPSSSNAQSALGALLVRVGENDNALVHLSRAIELDPRELSAYVNRGEVYLRLGRRTEGEAD
jgi:Flp pilus assembly protein TadD